MMLLALLASACFPVLGPNITARDMAAALPGFTPADPAEVFGYSPTPGVQRVVHPAEVKQFLIREHSDAAVPLANVCFERPTALITADAASKAMQEALSPEARIEIVELSRFPAPSGRLVFPRENLGAPPIALWQGYVLYDASKRFPIWARVKITVHAVRVVALEQLRPGVPIQASQLALVNVEEFPSRHAAPATIAQVQGALPRRFIAANSPVWSDAIDPPNAINKGDRVSVLVRSGRAQLLFDAEAETSGRLGDLVAFKNPESGKLFHARVDGPGQAEVDTPTLRP